MIYHRSAKGNYMEGSPERGGIHRAWRDPLSVEGSTERGGDTPRGRRPQGVSPTREVDPDTRGGKTFATEREGEVMSLFYDLRKITLMSR